MARIQHLNGVVLKRAARSAFTVSELASDAFQAGVEQWHSEPVIGALWLLNSSSFGHAPAGPGGRSRIHI